MDGCSSGTDSHFASNIIGKILRKTAKNQFYQEFACKQTKTNQQLLKDCFRELFEDLKLMNNKLNLQYDELLSTVLVAIVDKSDMSCDILAIGDGIVCADGKLTEYEQDNKPDYIGYHLQKDFDQWFDDQSQKMTLTKFSDLSIGTDGIWTFKEFDTINERRVNDSELCDLFFIDKEGYENEKMLFKKLIKVEKEYKLKPTDDLTIVRIIA